MLNIMDMKQNYQIWSVIFFFGKRTGSEVSVNEELAQELHKPGIQKFLRIKVHATFKDNT